MPVNTEHLRIVRYPDAALREPAERIEQVTDEVRAVARRMLALMHEAGGVGLAGPQVALPWRLFVANPTGDPDDDRVYINPVLREPSPRTVAAEEGCLSIPDVRGQIMRPVAITLDALNEQGRPVRDRSEALLARIWQHETDHLDGVLILDRMPPKEKRANHRAIEALETAGAK